MNKCSKCSNDAKYNGVSIINKETKENKVIYNQPVCEPCSKELLKCSECKQKEADRIITKAKVEIIVCEECYKKSKEKKQACQCQKVIKKLKPWQIYAKAEILKNCKGKDCKNTAKDYNNFFNYSDFTHGEFQLCKVCQNTRQHETAGLGNVQDVADKCFNCYQSETEKKEKSKQIKETEKINEGLCQSCQNELNKPLQEWEKNKAKIKLEAVKCDNHNSSAINYYNNVGKRIGSKYQGGTNTQHLCINCEKGGAEISRWGDYPPCNQCGKNVLEKELNKIKPREDFNIKAVKKMPEGVKLDDKLATKLPSLKQIEQIFIDYNIVKVERVNGQLIITFKNEAKVKDCQLSQKEQQNIHNFLSDNNLNELTQEQFTTPAQHTQNHAHSSKVVPLIISGAVLVSAILALCFWVYFKSKK